MFGFDLRWFLVLNFVAFVFWVLWLILGVVTCDFCLCFDG